MPAATATGPIRRLADRAAGATGLLRPALASGLIAAGLALGLGAIAARLVWVVFAPATLGWEGRPLVVGTLPPGHMPEATAALTGFDPFHRRLGEPAASAAPADAVPETTLDLKLTGVRAPLGGGTGSAIIRTPDHAQRAYSPGEEVLSGVRLVAVRPGAVVLERSGRRETLYLDERARQSGAQGPSAAESPPPAISLPQLEGIELAPRFRDGRMSGVRVTMTETATFLQRNGLNSGDVLLAVNGIEITSPARVQAALRALQRAGTADVVIERNGRERTLTLSLDG